MMQDSLEYGNHRWRTRDLGQALPGKVTLIIDGSHSATMADGSVLWPQP